MKLRKLATEVEMKTISDTAKLRLKFLPELNTMFPVIGRVMAEEKKSMTEWLETATRKTRGHDKDIVNAGLSTLETILKEKHRKGYVREDWSNERVSRSVSILCGRGEDWHDTGAAINARNCNDGSQQKDLFPTTKSVWRKAVKDHTVELQAMLPAAAPATVKKDDEQKAA